MYPEEMVNPMRAELTDAGFKNLYTADDVKNAIKAEGTTLVVINSVCGCAARNARPGAKMSLEGGKKPATLESGAVVQVPFHVVEGDVIKVDTVRGEYLEKVK